MPVHHEIDADAGLIVVYLSGAVTAAEIFGYYATLAADPTLRPNLAVLADCRGVTSVPSFREMGGVANARPRAAPSVRPTRAAVLVSSPWLFGIARQFAALAEPNGIQVTPFYDAAEANQWLADTADAVPTADRVR